MSENRIISIDGMVKDQYLSPHANLYNVDCILGLQAMMRSLPPGCVDHILFSPPFSGRGRDLFVYSASDHDVGNSKGDGVFEEHMSHLAPELFRALKPGRMMAVHCMDIQLTETHHGVIGFFDFPGQLVRMYEAAGFVYYGRVTIWKDPVVAEQRTHARNLGHSLMCDDSAMSSIGLPDYILLMRKPGTNAEPISHMRPCESSGKRVLSDEEIAKRAKVTGEIEAATGREVEMTLMRAKCPTCERSLAIGEDGLYPEHLVPKDDLARKDDANKPRHWQQVASPVWATPEDELSRTMRAIYAAILRGDGDRAADLARVAAVTRAANDWGMPLHSMVWATANGVYEGDGFVDYESPRAGNSDKRGIDQTDTLNTRSAREHEHERHICPLQIGVVKRLLSLYTNPGNVVLDPFGGIGTTPMVAVEMGRRAVAFELKGTYYRQMIENVQRVEPGAVGQQLSLLGESKAVA